MARYASKRVLTLNEQKRIKEIEVMMWAIRFQERREALIHELLPDVNVAEMSGKIHQLFARGSVTQEEAYIYMSETRIPAKVITSILNKNPRWFDHKNSEEIQTKFLKAYSTDNDLKLFEQLIDNFNEKYNIAKHHWTFRINWPEESPDEIEEEGLFE